MANGKRNTSAVAANETKGEKFVRLATTRTNRILKGLDSLGKLSNSGYERTPDQVQKIFSAINDKAKVAYDRLLGVSKSATPGFKL